MITINPGLLLATALTFLAAVFIIWKFAWKPLGQMMSARQEKIRSSLDDAERLREKNQEMEEDYQLRLKEFHRETTKLISQARQEGMKVREEIMRQAQTEAEEALQKARLEMESERKRMVTELRSETTLLSLEIAEKVLRRVLGEEDRKKLFAEILPQIDSFRENGGEKETQKPS